MTKLAYQRALGCLAALLAVSTAGCEDVIEQVADQCNLECPEAGILQGNASISGVPSIDAFFSSVITFETEAKGVAADASEILGRIEASVADQAGGDLRAKIRAKIEANVEGSLDVRIEPPRCEASVQVAIDAAARCDVDVDPGSIEVMCMGTCVAEANVSGGCDAQAEVRCSGTAPSLRCSGQCNAECSFGAQATCEGRCMGGCMGECRVNINGGMCEGTCRGKCVVDGEVGSEGNSFDGECAGMCEGTCEPPNADVMCAGSCSGECTGSCEVDVMGECSGTCEGRCDYTPASLECEANAEVKCEIEADANIACDGKCEGEVVAPMVKAECEASASVEAEARVECLPPRLEVDFQFAASIAGDVQAEAEFRAWLNGFRADLAALRALDAKAKLVLRAGGKVVNAAGGAVKGAFEASADLEGVLGVACAITELENIEEVVNSASEEMMSAVEGSADVFGAVSIGG